MAPKKNMWTPEEEAAFKAGVEKHGTGKWAKILNDEQYSAILKDRSNVNLKDKWRNMCGTQPTLEHGDNTLVIAVENDTVLVAKPPLASSSELQKDGNLFSRLKDRSNVNLEPTSEHGDNTLVSVAVENDTVLVAKPHLASSSELQKDGHLSARLKDRSNVILKPTSEHGDNTLVSVAVENDIVLVAKPPLASSSSIQKDNSANQTRILTETLVAAELEQIKRMRVSEAVKAAAKALEEADAALTEAEARMKQRLS